jgi:hypothetical protein
MAEPIYHHQVDGQEVEQEDLNLLGATSGLADDRVLAELLRLAPYDGVTVAKALMPFGHRGSNWGTLVPNGASGTARVLPFRAIVGSRTKVDTSPVDAWRDIRSAVYAQSTGQGALGAAVAFAPNTAGLPRWDLVYLAFNTDMNGASRTRFVRDPGTGAITSPAVVTTLVQQLTVMVAQGTPSATPAVPNLPNDAAGTYYIPLAHVRVDANFGPTSTLLPTDILSVAPVVSIARSAGGVCLQPANQQFVPGGAALTPDRIASWASSKTRPNFFLPPEMQGGESRIIALDFSGPNPSHPTVLGVVDDSRDWRNRLFRWTCFVKAASAQGAAGFAWGSPAPPIPSQVPTARGVGVGQDVQVGFGQSFVNDVNDPPFAGGFAIYLTPPPTGGGAPQASNLAQLNTPIGLMVDVTDGKLKVYLPANANPRFVMLVWLDATAPYPNWA